MDPIKYPTIYNSWYECSRGAHKVSTKLLSKMGYAYVNKYNVGIKYNCEPVITY